MAGASPTQQKFAGAMGLTVLLLACLYRWGDGLGFGGAAVTSQAPAVAATTATPTTAAGPPARGGVALPTEIAAWSPEAIVDAVRPDAIERAKPEARTAAVDALKRAARAREEGRWLNPVNNNALHFIDLALTEVPGSQRARAARRMLVDALLADATTALDRGEDRSAVALLAAVEIPDGEAGTTLRALGARVAVQRPLRRKLAEGNRRFSAQAVFAPRGASALDSFRAALALDPRSDAARAGLEDVAARILESALSAAAQDRSADAASLLQLAASINIGNSAQLAARAQIDSVKTTRAQAQAARVRAALEARQLELASELLARLRAVGFDSPLQTIDDLEDRLDVLQRYGGRAPGEVFQDVFRDRSARGPEVVVMPLGEFDMGSPPNEADRRRNEGPVRNVRVARPFGLARHETTVEEFARFVAATGHVTDAETLGHSFVWDERAGRLVRADKLSWRQGFTGKRALPTAPVMHLSWRDASSYANWLSNRTGEVYRLPSEAEFEFAMRAGKATRYPWGPAAPPSALENVAGARDRSVESRAWVAGFEDYGDGFWGPAPAGHMPANSYGLHDIGGNLSEWVADCWHDSYRRAPPDAAPWINPGCTRHVARGASWGSSPPEARTAYRDNQGADARSSRLGFRVARDL